MFVKRIVLSDQLIIGRKDYLSGWDLMTHNTPTSTLTPAPAPSTLWRGCGGIIKKISHKIKRNQKVETIEKMPNTSKFLYFKLV